MSNKLKVVWMAIYVFVTATGQLSSYCPNDTDPVASTATLAANGLTALSGQPATDATHVWSAAQKSVVVVTAPHSVLSVLAFWQRFTQTEREGIENLLATGTQTVKNRINAFARYVQSNNLVDCNDPYIQSSVLALETAGVLITGRAAVITA